MEDRHLAVRLSAELLGCGLKNPASNRTRKVGLYSELIDAPEGCWLHQEHVMFLATRTEVDPIY
jgi:hypothetical protein